MKKYQKIETLFKRDEKTHKLIIGNFRNETVEYLKECEWEFTEKVDGTNIRIYWNGHNVEFAGRTDNAQIPPHLLKYLNDKFGGEINEQMFEQKFGVTEVILYGEGYGTKIQKGGAYRDDVAFILFDVEITDMFLKRDGLEDIAQYFNVEVVPVVLCTTLEKGLDYVLNNTWSFVSKLNPANKDRAKIEGLVGKPRCEMYDRRGNRIIVKIKRKDFLEK
jgi:hypothetical protein